MLCTRSRCGTWRRLIPRRVYRGAQRMLTSPPTGETIDRPLRELEDSLRGWMIQVTRAMRPYFARMRQFQEGSRGGRGVALRAGWLRAEHGRQAGALARSLRGPTRPQIDRNIRAGTLGTYWHGLYIRKVPEDVAGVSGRTTSALSR